jgi:hypothetical protein
MQLKRFILVCVGFVVINQASAQEKPTFIRKKFAKVKITPTHLSTVEKLNLIKLPTFKTPKNVTITPKVTLANTEVTLNTNVLESPAWQMSFWNAQSVDNFGTVSFSAPSCVSYTGVSINSKATGVFLFEVSIGTYAGCPTEFDVNTVDFNANEGKGSNFEQSANYVPGTKGMGMLYFTVSANIGDEIDLQCANITSDSNQYWSFFNCTITEIHQ